ncbi:MAG: hypothetical protein B6I25_07935 [Planctomycetales bacterium 4572_13]|nr:MAG: hypothetical protein B6I25_07935 [Planctomycetales bacterium 4572_13]
MATGYIPRGDNDFLVWVTNFDTYATAHLAELGITAGDMIPITAGRIDFDTKLTANVTAQQAAQSARQGKTDSRSQLESVTRALVRQLQASPDVDDTERAALGITVPDTVKTMATASISTRPVGVVDTSQRLRHEIRFFDEATPTSRAKPAGVMGCEIWVKVLPAGDAPPVGDDGLSFVTLDTASPYTVEYDGTDGGKTAHYMLRWVKKNGDKGPWSETVSATITA